MAEHPKVFISYSHDSSAHKQWVSEFGAILRHNGVDAVLDQWDLNPGDDMTRFMEKGVKESDRVLVVCTDSYVKKANDGEGGVGYEKLVLTAKLVQDLGTNKFIPIIRHASGKEKVPTFLGTRVHIDFTDDSKFDQALMELLRTLHQVRKARKPPLGKSPFTEPETLAPRKTTNSLTSPKVENDPGEFVLLWPEDGEQYFVPIQNASWDSTEIILKLLPESGEQTAFLNSLRKSIGNNSTRHTFALALEEEAAWVIPQEVTQNTSGSPTVWEVVLKVDSIRQNFALSREIGISGFSPDEIAEMRAKRILLNESLETTNPSTFYLRNQLLESSIFRQASSPYGSIPQITESPIPNLYRSFGKEPERFKKFARLVSVLYLKLSNTCEDILKLDFKLLKSKKLRVKFEGKRRQQYSFYSNVEPIIIKVDGICHLNV